MDEIKLEATGEDPFVAEEQESVKLIDHEGSRKHLIHHVHMSVSMLLLFIAFGAIQNLVGALNGSIGQLSLAIIYTSLCLSSIIVGPVVVTFLKPKLSFIIGALCYLSFILANRWPTPFLLTFTAALLGIGGSILWNAEATYLIQAASNYALKKGEDRKSAMGYFNGIFFAIFQINQVTGNLISGIVLTSELSGSKDALSYVFIGVGGLSVLSFLFLSPEESAAPPQQRSFLEKIFKAIVLLKDKRLLLLLPVLFYCGLQQGVIVGAFASEILSQTVGVGQIGFVMAVFGLFDVLGSFLMGKIADRFHTPPLIFIGLITHSIFLISLFFTTIHTKFTFLQQQPYLLYLLAALYGVGDAAWNTFPNILLSILFVNDPESAFANLKFWQSLGAVLPFLLGTFLVQSTTTLGVSFIFLWLAVTSTVLLELLFKVFTLEKGSIRT